MVKELTSRPNLESFATRAGMLIGSETSREVETIVGRLQNDLKLLLDASQVLQVNYEHQSPRMALAMVSPRH